MTPTGSLAAMTIDNDDDLAGLQRSGAVVAEARDAMVAAVVPGISTGELDAIGRSVMRRHGARSAPRKGVAASDPRPAPKKATDSDPRPTSKP